MPRPTLRQRIARRIPDAVDDETGRSMRQIKQLPYGERPFIYKRPSKIHISMDLLYLPRDRTGNKYALVAVDFGTRKIAVIPTKNKKASTMREGLKTILNEDTISNNNKLKAIYVDDGKEFKGEFARYCATNNIRLQISLPNRHKQNALAESTNNTLSKAIFEYQHIKEKQTGQTYRNWVHIIPQLVDAINEQRAARPPRIPKEQQQLLKEGKSACSGDWCKLLRMGDVVRRRLDRFEEIDGISTDSRLRGADIKYEATRRKITNIVLLPGQPPMYELEGIKTARFTKNELMLVGKL